LPENSEKKFRKKIKNSGDFNKNFQAIYNRNLNDYRNFQVLYDKDTKHGVDEVKQAEYDLRISEELENLKTYKAS